MPECEFVEKTKLYTGEISSLEHLQEDVKELRAGFECGIAIRGLSDYLEGDVIECFVKEKKEVV